MKSIIKEILNEIIKENEQLQVCKTDQVTNKFLREFNLWRTGLCNQDTFLTPEKIKVLINKNFKNNVQSIKLDNGSEITKTEYEKRLNDDYRDRLSMCVSPYIGERVKSENTCEVSLTDYSKPEIRNAFNRYMKYPINCNIFESETCGDPKNIITKSVTNIPSKFQQELVKSNLTVKEPQIQEPESKVGQIAKKITKQVKNRFGS